MQSTSDPTLHWVVKNWDQLPPLVIELIQRISTLTLGTPTEPSYPIKKFARMCARRCRSIVQGCLREEEWLDADLEFYGAIEDEIQRSLTSEAAAVLPIEGSIGK